MRLRGVAGYVSKLRVSFQGAPREVRVLGKLSRSPLSFHRWGDGGPERSWRADCWGRRHVLGGAGGPCGYRGPPVGPPACPPASVGLTAQHPALALRCRHTALWPGDPGGLGGLPRRGSCRRTPCGVILSLSHVEAFFLRQEENSHGVQMPF